MQAHAVRAALATILGAIVLAGCKSAPPNKAPVEDRRGLAPTALVVSRPVDEQVPGAENAGKPGYYTVRPGDTLIRIGLEHGQSWKDLALWNSMDNPNVLEVGQVLRVTPPQGAQTAAISSSPVTATAVAPVAPPPVTPSPPARTTTTTAAAATPPASATQTPPAAAQGEDIRFIWPAQGPLTARFDEVSNKGYDISGNMGDPVVAAAAGRVVYAGHGLRGYGNLVIIKHNNTYLTAYAHNKTLLVKEEEAVKQGQKIAEMGNTDADRVKLHFEIRRMGKPVDPGKYLSAR